VIRKGSGKDGTRQINAEQQKHKRPKPYLDTKQGRERQGKRWVGERTRYKGLTLLAYRPNRISGRSGEMWDIREQDRESVDGKGRRPDRRGENTTVGRATEKNKDEGTTGARSHWSRPAAEVVIPLIRWFLMIRLTSRLCLKFTRFSHQSLSVSLSGHSLANRPSPLSVLTLSRPNSAY
jgi:hypothetical protein